MKTMTMLTSVLGVLSAGGLLSLQHATGKNRPRVHRLRVGRARVPQALKDRQLELADQPPRRRSHVSAGGP